MEEKQKIEEFIQQNSLDGGFLQSQNWLNFQEKVGRKILFFEKEGFVANVVEHSLPIVGQYFYCPRGPIMKHEAWNNEQKQLLRELIGLAKKNNIGWVRIEPANKELLEIIKENISEKVVKAPHDMQPREIFVLDISKSEEQLLREMKSKTRYNINLAKKKGVVVSCQSSAISNQKKEECTEAFLKLTKEMAERQGIATHPEEYYRKMLKSFPEEMLKLYVSEFEGKIIAANLILIFGKFATYLHGASSNEHRNVMAPFLLQWQAILDAKQQGCENYDFGGVKTVTNVRKPGTGSDWAGITNFKLGFSPATKPMVFPGCYDIIINPRKYAVYRGLQRAKSFAVMFKKRLKK